ncbi:MAG TPA: hypothetical protein V6C95_09185 [Coleofasciculaceae cyanobacterium]
MVTHRKLVNVYLPDELYQALIAYQEQQGEKGDSEAIVEILTQFLLTRNEAKRYVTVEQMEVLEGKVRYLIQQVAQLTQVIASSRQSELNGAGTPIRSESLAQLSPTVSGISGYEIEEDEDEPDEILYSFLEPGS